MSGCGEWVGVVGEWVRKRAGIRAGNAVLAGVPFHVLEPREVPGRGDEPKCGAKAIRRRYYTGHGTLTIPAIADERPWAIRLFRPGIDGDWPTTQFRRAAGSRSGRRDRVRHGR